MRFHPELRPPSVLKTCEQHGFSTLNHNLGYCYDDARVLKWLWRQVRNGLKGGVGSFED